jgi:hypothetical protein
MLTRVHMSTTKRLARRSDERHEEPALDPATALPVLWPIGIAQRPVRLTDQEAEGIGSVPVHQLQTRSVFVEPSDQFVTLSLKRFEYGDAQSRLERKSQAGLPIEFGIPMR